MASIRAEMASAQRTSTRARSKQASTHDFDQPHNPADEDMVQNLSRELGHRSQHSSRSSIDYDSLRQEEALMKERIEQAQRDRQKSIKTGHDLSLEEAYRQIAKYKNRAQELKQQVIAEKNARESQEKDLGELREKCSELQAELRISLEENSMLNKIAGSVHSNSTRREISDAIEKAEKATKEKNEALTRLQALELALARKSAGIDDKEANMRADIQDLQEKRALVMKSQITELEEERETWQKHAAELEAKVTLAEAKIDALGTEHGSAAARHEQAEQERDQALDDLNRLRMQTARLRSENADMRRMTGSDTASRASVSNAALEDAIAQRDEATKKYHELLSMPAGYSSDHEQVELLQLQLQKSILHRNKLSTDLRAAMERNAQSESIAQQKIHVLEAAVEDYRRMSRFNDRGSQETICMMQARQDEMRAYRSAITELREYTHSKSHAGDARASKVLAHADTAEYDQLPPNWEMMVSPEGLEYYVDHERRRTTWVHPGPKGGLGYMVGHDLSSVDEREVYADGTPILDIDPEHVVLARKVHRLRASYNGLR